jgi:hypothetical protein
MFRNALRPGDGRMEIRKERSMATNMPSSVAARVMAWLVIAVIHFSLSQLILPATAALTSHTSGALERPDLPVTLLVRLTKLLHFPLVTLALYPREWFPGNWVYLPMAANSLIWAFGICLLLRLYRKKP